MTAPRNLHQFALDVELAALQARLTELVYQEMTTQGVSQRELARRLNVTPEWVKDWLGGKKTTFRTLTEAALALGKRIDPQLIDLQPKEATQ